MQEAHRSRKGGTEAMTREENLDYRRSCPYDAMGDYSVLFTEDKQKKEDRGTGLPQPDISVKQVK